jgi:hypothetical protein
MAAAASQYEVASHPVVTPLQGDPTGPEVGVTHAGGLADRSQAAPWTHVFALQGWPTGVRSTHWPHVVTVVSGPASPIAAEKKHSPL